MVDVADARFTTGERLDVDAVRERPGREQFGAEVVGQEIADVERRRNVGVDDEERRRNLEALLLRVDLREADADEPVALLGMCRDRRRERGCHGKRK